MEASTFRPYVRSDFCLIFPSFKVNIIWLVPLERSRASSPASCGSYWKIYNSWRASVGC